MSFSASDKKRLLDSLMGRIREESCEAAGTTREAVREALHHAPRVVLAALDDAFDMAFQRGMQEERKVRA